MKDQEKTKEQLISELVELRQEKHKRKRAEEALRESESSMKKAQRIAHAGFWDLNIITGALYWSDETYRIYGYKPQEFVPTYEKFLSILHPDDSEFVQKEINDVLQNNKDYNIDYRFLRLDGKIGWVHCEGEVTRNKEDKSIRYFGTQVDITERKQAEEEIQKFKTIADKAGYGVGITDLEGNLLYLNQAFSQMHGYTADELLGKNLSIFHNEEQLKNVDRLVGLLMQEGSYVSEEVWHKRKDDTIFPALMNGTLIRDDKGNPVVMAATVMDITERKQAEEQLKKYQEMVLQMNDGIVITNPQGTLLEINDCFTRMTGWTREDLVGTKPPYKYWRKTDVPIIMETLSDLRNLDQTVSAFEQILQKKDGGEIHVLVNSTILYDNNNKQKAFFGLFRDITDIKRAEESLHKESHALGERVKELNCLYGIAKLVEKPDISLDEIIQGTVDLIPPSWQYPEVTCARAIIDGQQIETVPFRETSWKQSSEIRVYNKQFGMLEVFYMEEKPEIDEGPFLEEERSLIDAVAEQLGGITERKRAEEKLLESEERFHTFMNYYPYAAYIKDDSLRFVYGNPLMLRDFGTSLDKLVGTTIHDTPAKERARQTETADRKVLEELVSVELEQLSTEKAGRTFFRNIKFPIRMPSGAVLIGGITVDITERKKAEEKLRESEEHFRLLMQSIPSFVVEADLAGKILSLNKGYPGFSLEDYVGKSILDVSHPKGREIRKKSFYDVIEKCNPVEYEAEGYGPNKSQAYYKYKIAPVFRDGEIKSILMVVDEITERKQAEEALRHERDLLHTLMANIPDTIYFKNTDSQFTRINKAQARFLGLRDPQEAVSKTDFDYFTAKRAQDFRAEEEEIIKSGEPLINKAQEIRQADGQIRWVSSTKVPFKNRIGKVIGIVGISRDITERKQAEEDLRQLNQFRESIIQNANVWLDVLDEKANIVVWNKAAEKISGYCREEVIGHGKIWEWLYPDKKYRKEMTETAASIIKGEAVEDFETTITCKNGSISIISWYSRNLLDEEDSIVGSVALGRDITKRKRAEEALREQREELQLILDTVPAMIWFKDKNNKILRINKAAAETMGMRVEEIEGKRAEELFPDEDAEKYLKDDVEVMNSGKPLH